MIRKPLSPWMFLAGVMMVAIVIFIARRVAATAQSQNAQVPVIAQPATWVPFAAEIIQSSPGAPDLVGTYVRASNGSDRYDQSTRDGSVHIVTIVNVFTGWQYGCNIGRNVCQRQQLTSPTRPVTSWRVDTQGLAKTNQNVEGYEVYEYTSVRGTKTLLAPALNFAALVTDDPGEMHRTLFNIKLGEPDLSVFDPPAGAKMVDKPHR
jgi:hypothetical protein